MLSSILCMVVLFCIWVGTAGHMEDGSGVTNDIIASYITAFLYVAIAGIAAIQLYINW